MPFLAACVLRYALRRHLGQSADYTLATCRLV